MKTKKPSIETLSDRMKKYDAVTTEISELYAMLKT